MPGVQLQKQTGQPAIFGRTHFPFAIALLSSVVLHLVLLGTRTFSVKHGEPVAMANTANLVGIWNTQLLRSATLPLPVIDGDHHPSESTSFSPAPSSSKKQQPEQAMSDIHFYLFDEVETPAIPFDDWVFPQDSDGSTEHLRSAIFRIWILETGEVQDVAILRTVPANLSADQKNYLIEGIKKTRTRPAFRDGAPVASERTIEMVFDSGQSNGSAAPLFGTTSVLTDR